MTAGEPAGSRVERRSRDHPRHGWRYWRLTPEPRLQSLSQRGFTWEPARPLVARCAGTGAAGHDAPDPGCACGIHASPDLAALHADALCLVPGPLVVGQVALWGRVVVDDHGYRGTYAHPRRLDVVEETVVGVVSLDEVVEGLAAYGVPVGTAPLVEAVGPASATIMGFLSLSEASPPLAR